MAPAQTSASTKPSSNSKVTTIRSGVQTKSTSRQTNNPQPQHRSAQAGSQPLTSIGTDAEAVQPENVDQPLLPSSEAQTQTRGRLASRVHPIQSSGTTPSQVSSRSHHGSTERAVSATGSQPGAQASIRARSTSASRPTISSSVRSHSQDSHPRSTPTYRPGSSTSSRPSSSSGVAATSFTSGPVVPESRSRSTSRSRAIPSSHNSTNQSQGRARSLAPRGDIRVVSSNNRAKLGVAGEIPHGWFSLCVSVDSIIDSASPRIVTVQFWIRPKPDRTGGGAWKLRQSFHSDSNKLVLDSSSDSSSEFVSMAGDCLTILVLSRDGVAQKRRKEIAALLKEAFEASDDASLPQNQRFTSYTKCALSCLVREKIIQTTTKQGLVDMAPLHQEVDQFFAQLGSFKTHWQSAKYSW
ncbi:hypothetical protein NP233_g12584 [Leucocoprinus birnbaumii]|uniref:Uncharacterized protein n=1 Tax=Leucocoprinus birnbaumii TaxID=56174 RepID=A0AAD5YPV7_9AGAR|nr:hypothetical protein NP233_g12584 [Leucocoprinus birnbaumii]